MPREVTDPGDPERFISNHLDLDCQSQLLDPSIEVMQFSSVTSPSISTFFRQDVTGEAVGNAAVATP